MLDILFLQNSGFFKTKILEKGEILFNEGDFDNNIYLIISGNLQIEKYTTKDKLETKILAKLEKNEIFGEAALNTNNPKEVTIIAKNKTKLLYIDAKDGLEKFSKKYSKQGLNLLKYIIYLSNKRLLESNYLITANYKISNEINNIKEINNKSLFELMQKLKDIISVDYILYLEENPVMNNYVTLKYDTRNPGKMLDEVIEVTENKLIILELKNKGYNNYIQNLSIGNDNLGLLIYFRKSNNFNDNDKKVLVSASTSIAGLIKQKNIIEEQKNKDSLSDTL